MNKKICFFMDSIFSIGGVQRVTAVIAKKLAIDYDVTIVSLDSPSKMNKTLYDLNESQITYRLFQFPSISGWKIFLYKIYSVFYRKILPQNKHTSIWYSNCFLPPIQRNALINELSTSNYDIIIGVHAPFAAYLAVCKSKLNNTKLIGWIHNSYEALFGKKSFYIGHELKKYYEYQLETLDATVVLCQFDAQQYHFPTKVIYNPLTLVPGERSKGTSKKFLTVGRFSHLHKGFDLLIEAFHIFAEDNKEWTLDIVGEGPEETMYRQLIQKYKLEDRITIHPFTNHIQKYYSDAQVYILSSRWEGMPLVLMEAMSHGLPVLSSDLPICQEVLGNFALYFENGNIKQLAQRLEDVTHIDWSIKSMEALEIANLYNIDSIISQWKKMIEA